MTAEQALQQQTGLNPDQARAVAITDCPVMVLAGPGSGKTRMLVAKYVHLVEQGIDPDAILITTFTRKASEELSQRIASALQEHGHHSSIEVQNFHGFCLRLLEEFGPQAGFATSLRVLQGVDLAKFIDEHASAFQWDHCPFVRRRDYEIDQLVKFTGNALSGGLTPDAAVALAEKRVAEGVVKEERLGEYLDHARNYGRLLELLSSQGLLMYDTMLQEAIRLLEQNPAVLAEIRARFQYVLVDEVQDNNALQAGLIELLIGDRPCVTVVGDEDQGIYKFRGAQKDILHRFQERFQPEVVFLGQNYRSSRIIVDAAQRVIQNNPDRFEGKQLRAEGPNADGMEPVRCRTYRDDEQQAIHIATQIQGWKDAEPGRKWGNVAILYRSLKRKGRILDELEARGIPYEITALSQLMSMREVRDLVAWLRALWNPQTDNPAVERVLRSAEVGIPWEDLGTIQRRYDWKVRQATVEGEQYPSLVGMLRSLENLDVSDDAKRALERARNLFSRLSHETRGLGALETAQHVIRALDFHRRFPMDSPEGDQAWRNLADFLRIVADYEASHPDEGLRGFVAYLEYADRRGEGFEEREPDHQEDSVKILTHHRAKGLEFPIVFIPNAYTGSIPAKRQWDWLEEYNQGPDEKELAKQEHEAEERRTFFVAMTRAERELVLSRPRDIGGKEVEWSPFVQELAEAAPDGHVVFEDIDVFLEPAEAQGTPASRLVRERLHALMQEPRDAQDAEDRLRELVGAVATSWSVPGIRAWASQVGAVLPPGAVPEEKPHATLWLSPSSIQDYKDCPQKYQFRHSYAVPGKASATAVAGSNVHRALEVFHKEHRDDWRDQDTDKLLEIHDRVFASGRYRSQEEADQYKAWERRILEQYLDGEKAEAGDPTHFEVHFELRDEENDVVFNGFIDRVDAHLDGTVEVVDYKTGNPANLNRYQMPLYVMGLEQKGMQVRAATYYLMRDAGDGKGAIERKRTPRTATGKRGVISDVTLDEMKGEVQEMVKGIRAGAFEAKPEEFKCGFCDYRILCPSFEGGP